jgi:outer membrane protein assembly factor BamB
MVTCWFSGNSGSGDPILTVPAVVPVLVGPLQVLLAILPGLIVAVAGAVLSLLKPAAMKSALRVLWRLKLPVAAIVLACVGIVWGARTLLPKSPASIAAASGAGDWAMFRGGPERTGAAPGARGPDAGGPNWTTRNAGIDDGFFSSPAVVGNRVYAASANLGAFGKTGAVYCFDADTGHVAWKSEIDGYRATFSSPAVWKHYLVCGEGLHDTRDARVVCLDLRPGSEGKVLWTYHTKSHVECTPVIDDGRVYVGAGDDGYYCFELDPGDASGKVVWHLPGEQYLDAETSLAVHDGKVYAGLGNGGKALCVLDAKTGRELKRIPTPYPVFGPPSIRGGKLYVGMGNGDFIHTAEEVRAATLAKMRRDGAGDAELKAAEAALGPVGEVWCVDLATLNVDWKFPTTNTVLGSVAVAGDEIYAAARDGSVYGIGRDGRGVGRWDARDVILSSPAVTDRHVYVITNAGRLYGLDRRTMQSVWEAPVSSGPLCMSSPAVANGRVYVGTQQHGLVCAGRAGSAADETPLWAGHLGGPGKGGVVEPSALPEKGDYQWHFGVPAGQEGQGDEAVVVAPVAVVGERVYVPVAQGERRGLVCLPVEGTGQEAPPTLWYYPTTNGVYASPAVAGDVALVVDGKSGDAGRALHAIDARSGKPLWKVPVPSEASGALIADRKELFVQDTPGALSRFDFNGARLWTQPAGLMKHGTGVAPSIVVVATSEPRALLALDRPTGRELWRVTMDAAPTTSPAMEGAVIRLGTKRGLEVRSLVDGQQITGWRVEGGGVSGDFAVDAQHLAYVNDSGEAVVLSKADGSVLRRVAGAAPGSSVILLRDVALVDAKGGLMKVPLGADVPAEQVQWADTTWLGKPAGPMVMSGSRVYVPRTGWGLVRLGAGR